MLASMPASKRTIIGKLSPLMAARLHTRRAAGAGFVLVLVVMMIWKMREARNDIAFLRQNAQQNVIDIKAIDFEASSLLGCNAA